MSGKQNDRLGELRIRVQAAHRGKRLHNKDRKELCHGEIMQRLARRLP